MKLAKAMLWLVAGTLCALPAAEPALAGDPIVSLQPLHTGLDAVTEPAFEGVWVFASESLQLRVTKGEDHYVLQLCSADEKVSLWFEAHLVRLGSTVFADIKQTSDNDLFLLSPHVFAKIRADDDELHFDFLDERYVRAALENGRTSLAHESMESTLVLTASTRELQNFVESCAFDDDAFGENVSFTRLKEQPGNAQP